MARYLQKIVVKTRIMLLRHLSGCKDFILKGVPNIDMGADIEISRRSNISIGSGFSMRKNSLVAVRENASITIGNGVFINRNTIIVARNAITIGNHVTIGPNVCIYDHDHSMNKGEYLLETVEIMDDVWIGANVTILKGVKIGRNSIIAAGCIVSKNLPDKSILIQKRESLIIPIQKSEVSNTKV